MAKAPLTMRQMRDVLDSQFAHNPGGLSSLTTDQIRETFNGNQLGARLVMFDEPGPSDPKDCLAVLVVASDGGCLVRTPLDRAEVAVLVQQFVSRLI